jgi:hypothetical protein
MAKQNGRPADDRPSDAPALPPNASGGDTVTVACKLPGGLILQLQKPEEMTEQAPSGPRTIKVYRRYGDKYVVKGTALPFGTVPRYLIAGGYALTAGIPRDFWEQWEKQNADNAVLLSGLLFAVARTEDAESEANNRAALRHGLEPIDPSKLPAGVQSAEENGRRFSR